MEILAVIIAVSFFVGVVCLAFAAVTEGGVRAFLATVGAIAMTIFVATLVLYVVLVNIPS